MASTGAETQGFQAGDEPADTGQSSVAKPKRKPPKSPREKFQEIMALMGSKNHFTLGEFFEHLLDPNVSKLQDSEKAMLTHWLRATAKSGYRPVEAVAAMYQHPLSIEFSEGKLQHSDFSELAPQKHSPLYLDKYPREAEFLPHPSSSSKHFNAREGLEELFARSTIAMVDLEAEKLCSPTDGLSRGAKATWDALSTYSLAREHSVVQKHAPVSWSIASTMAWNRDREWKADMATEEVLNDEADAPDTSGKSPPALEY